MKRLLRLLHLYFYQFCIAVSFLSLYPLINHFAKKPANLKWLNRLRKIFSFFSSAFAGIFFKFRFEEAIDWSKTYIICGNHTTNLDVTAVVLLVQNDYVFMGKDELLNNLVTRKYFESIDIPLNRESKMSAFRAFKRADECLKNGISVVIFPEGQIPDQYPPVMQPYKNGPFKLAIENKIDILPISLKNNWKLMWDDGSKHGSRPGISDICVHKPISTQFLTADDAESLKNQVFDIINKEL